MGLLISDGCTTGGPAWSIMLGFNPTAVAALSSDVHDGSTARHLASARWSAGCNV